MDENENIEPIRGKLQNANKYIPSHNSSINNVKYDTDHHDDHRANHRANHRVDHRVNDNTKLSLIIPKFKKINGMIGKIKIFDQELSDRYDKRARCIVKSKLGPAVKNNPDKYAEDMIVVTNRIPYGYMELQVYGKWTENIFPYDSPFIYERKMKFCETTLFICFNASYDKLVMFSRTSIHPKRHRVKKYSREYIHYVPWSKAILLDTDKLSIEIIRQYCGLFDDEGSENEYDMNHINDKKIYASNHTCIAKDAIKDNIICENNLISSETLCDDIVSSADTCH